MFQSGREKRVSDEGNAGYRAEKNIKMRPQDVIFDGFFCMLPPFVLCKLTKTSLRRSHEGSKNEVEWGVNRENDKKF